MTYTLLSVLFLILACKKDSQSQKGISPLISPPSSSTINGKELSELYCVACHQYPKPALLDRETWKEYMLPRMGYMYGIYGSPEEREALFEKGSGGDIVRQRDLFPATQKLDSTSWLAIKKYYLDNAPEALEEPPIKNINKNLKQFVVRIPNQKVQIPSSTMAKFANDGKIYLGDAMTRSFSLFSQELDLLQSGTIEEGTVWLEDFPEAYWLTVMGSFSPTDAPKGSIAVLPKSPNVRASIPITNLQRPVHSSYSDLDSDGDMDIVICEFGKWTGALSLHLNNGNNTFSKKILHNTPGAIKAYIQDMNNDGFEDIVALFAQGAEGIDIFYNDGTANFKRERVLDFHPSMGSSYFNLIDYDKDGFLDIIYTAGDNADYKPVMKPWHGVYVYLNDSNNRFRESVFLHLNGAYNAIAEDFDADGDTDIAAISFFPDWVNSPEESFVYFENTNDIYSLSTFPEVTNGRWIVMDSSDYDQDGDIDLILGSLAFEVVPKLGFEKQWIEKGIPFIVLENTLH